MKVINKSTGAELDAKKYPMPVKGTDVAIKVNGEDVTAKTTSGRGKDYTYFVFKNVSLYVEGLVEAGAELDLDVPDDFGSAEPPAARKSYYVPKKGSKLNADGSIPAGGGSDAGADAEAAKTVVNEEGGEHAEMPDGSVVEPALEGETTTNHDGPADDQTGADPVAPKNRSKRKAKSDGDQGGDEGQAA